MRLPVKESMPSGYKGFTWTNGKYLNASAFRGTGYDKTISSGEFVSWFDNPMALQLIAVNQTFTLNSCIMSAGWSNDVSVDYHWLLLINTALQHHAIVKYLHKSGTDIQLVWFDSRPIQSVMELAILTLEWTICASHIETVVSQKSQSDMW